MDSLLDTEQSAATDTHFAEMQLVTAAATGNAVAFEQLMRRYNQRLFRTARSILKDDAEAEEAVQEAYLNAWRALGDFRGECRLSTWLIRITVNESLMRLRRQKRQAIRLVSLENAMLVPDPDLKEALTAAAGQEPQQQLQREQLRQQLEQQIDLLPSHYRSVFMLRVVEGLNVEETADALELPAATVRTQLFRARALLQAALGSLDDSCPSEAFAFDGERCNRIVENVLRRARDEGLASSD